MTRSTALSLLVEVAVPNDGAHWAPIVQVQRKKLLDYLERTWSDRMKDPYPFESRNLSLRRTWLGKHEKGLLRILTYPCGCHFTSPGVRKKRSLQDLIRNDGASAKPVASCRAPGQLIMLILTEWHEATSATIRKLLEPRYRRLT